MRITQEPNMLELWKNLHFEEEKRSVYTMFKIFSTYICWINIQNVTLEVSGAVRPLYASLGVKGLIYNKSINTWRLMWLTILTLQRYGSTRYLNFNKPLLLVILEFLQVSPEPGLVNPSAWGHLNPSSYCVWEGFFTGYLNYGLNCREKMKK